MLPTYAGCPTEVLVIGTPHLAQLKMQPKLDVTLDRLRAWAPDQIAVEVLPGDLVETYSQLGHPNAELRHGGRPVAWQLGQRAQQVTGWSRLEALAQARSGPIPQRALAYLAALEPHNALLHWEEADLPADLRADLGEFAQSPAESVSLGVALARQLGHASLCLFDEFPLTDWPTEQERAYLQAATSPDFEAWLSEQPGTQLPQHSDHWQTLLAVNAPQSVQQSIALETDVNFRLGLPGRMKQADWDARNLAIAARLRTATLPIPGDRLLVLVGLAHKGPLEAALRVLGPDVELVDLRALD
ncbi:DUF5694 domain-containing protein [Deinococcus piscis]|nr:DUF5694 domain-containing protein [Deinococcus piscis]